MDMGAQNFKCIGKMHLGVFRVYSKKAIRFDIQEYPHITQKIPEISTIYFNKNI
jgi:hypothetical protein